MPDDTENPMDADATIPMAAPVCTPGQRRGWDIPSPEELTALLPHDTYHVEGLLGQGGMGAVYKATQKRLQRKVAIKIMCQDQGQDYGFEERFRREALALAQLNHPNIVNVIDYGEASAEYLYIVMEYVDGTDLLGVIRSRQMTQELALSILPQICDALQFAHDNGIVHRDIKPANILLTRDGRVKVADFGLAKRFDVESAFHTLTGTGMGTPDYAAPEQFSPIASVDHRADIYALGVMIYQMITGTMPRGAWKYPSEIVHVDTHWDQIVSRALQTDPQERYASVSDVKTDLSTITQVFDALRRMPDRAPASSDTTACTPQAPRHVATQPSGRSTRLETCPNCKKSFQVDLTLMGQVVGCPYCRRKVSLGKGTNRSLAPSPTTSGRRSQIGVLVGVLALIVVMYLAGGWLRLWPLLPKTVAVPATHTSKVVVHEAWMAKELATGIGSRTMSITSNGMVFLVAHMKLDPALITDFHRLDEVELKRLTGDEPERMPKDADWHGYSIKTPQFRVIRKDGTSVAASGMRDGLEGGFTEATSMVRSEDHKANIIEFIVFFVLPIDECLIGGLKIQFKDEPAVPMTVSKSAM